MKNIKSEMMTIFKEVMQSNNEDGSFTLSDLPVDQLIQLFEVREKEAYKEGKERYNILNRNWVNKQIKKGLCRQCSKKAVIGRSRCAKHLEINNDYAREYRQKNS